MAKETLQPLAYHRAIRDFLKAEESRVWEWFASHKARDEQSDAVRFDLLKKTYRVDREANPKLYAAADEAARALAIEAPITVYQAQNAQGTNASLAYLPGEAHIVLSGPVQSKMSDAEFRAVLGHELAHYALFNGWDGEYLIAAQILAALTYDERSDNAHCATARLFDLYTEIFCDRAALRVVEDPRAVVSTLVKLETGLDDVNAESYIRQADEIFKKGPAKTAGLTHPEAFIRARAVELWHRGEDGVDARIAEMIEGPPTLGNLDLLAQRHVAGLTRRLIDALLAPRWLQTELVLAHARLFFPDYAPPASSSGNAALAADLATEDGQLADYYCYVLLDFVTADRELEEMPLAAALVLCDEVGLKDRFGEIVKKELKVSKKQFDKIDQEKGQVLKKAVEKVGGA